MSNPYSSEDLRRTVDALMGEVHSLEEENRSLKEENRTLREEISSQFESIRTHIQKSTETIRRNSALMEGTGGSRMVGPGGNGGELLGKITLMQEEIKSIDRDVGEIKEMVGDLADIKRELEEGVLETVSQMEEKDRQIGAYAAVNRKLSQIKDEYVELRRQLEH
jgi:methyl-accepting chemotaxis protein